MSIVYMYTQLDDVEGILFHCYVFFQCFMYVRYKVKDKIPFVMSSKIFDSIESTYTIQPNFWRGDGGWGIF